MAGRSEEACQILLEKLRRGQVSLHRNLQYLQPKKDAGEKRSSRQLGAGATHVRRRRRVDDSLCCVKHLPARRARTEQLSPSPPPLHFPRVKCRKRLSSTPKHSSPPLSPPLPPHSHLSPPHPPLPTGTLTTTDTSLENALLSRGNVARKRGRNGKRAKRRSLSSDAGCLKTGTIPKDGRSGTSLASAPSYPSREEREGTSREAGELSEMHSSISRVAALSSSVRSRYDRGGKKPRGLTVSFVSHENPHSPVVAGGGREGGVGARKRRSGEEVSVAGEKEKGECLVSSLNSSRFGALEHNRRKASLRPPSKALRLTASPQQRSWAVGETDRLGYDWIAGLVEVGSVLEDREEAWFEEMKEFRKVNHSECSRPHPAFLPDTHEDSSLLTPPHDPTSHSPGHTHCTQSYILNDRFFPVAQRDSGACGEGGRRCPVCEGKREKEEADTRSIHYIRVSVPRRSVQAPHQQLRPHRRRSFDPSDSMALNKHCLAGWNSTKPPSLPPQPTLDLKSSLAPSHHSHPPHPHPSPNSLPPSHPPPLKPPARERNGGRSSVSRRLLDSSHRSEYSLRSRGNIS